MDNTFGLIYRVTTFGESHSRGVGAIIDGCPPGIKISEEIIQKQLDRRRPGSSKLGTQRNESDTAIILSGVENGVTLGTPIAVMVENKDFRAGDYKGFNNVPRPSHADFTYLQKFGITASSGGGRASARETIGRVISGAIAMEVLKDYDIEIEAKIIQIGTCKGSLEEMEKEVERAKADKDSVGGVITCVCKNVPVGLGNPVFDKIDALLAQAMLSLPAVKGFEVGAGFESASRRGSENNDLFVAKKDEVYGDRLGTKTNNSGGIQGGIANGEDIVFNVAFKPTPTIGQAQLTTDYDGNVVALEGKGRHDPCVAIRATPVVEAMAAMVILDCLLRQNTITEWAFRQSFGINEE